MEKKAENIKEIVKQKYGEIAQQSMNQNSCCSSGSCCGDSGYTVFSEDYSQLSGYYAGADLNLGCGLPTELAGIQNGNTVIDLGSGAGNDCFVARAIVGDEGLVIGIDMTDAMIEKAGQNAMKLGFKNVQFMHGDIENLPITANKADVVISNCVLNLVPDKHQAFAEIFRVLKPGGHFSISDIVIQGDLPETLKKEAELYAGCVSGAVQKGEYLDIIKQTGFVNIEVQKEKEVALPDMLLLKYLSEPELASFRDSKTGIFSINVFAQKPACMCGNC